MFCLFSSLPGPPKPLAPGLFLLLGSHRLRLSNDVCGHV